MSEKERELLEAAKAKDAEGEAASEHSTRRHITLNAAGANYYITRRRERTEAQKRYSTTIQAAISQAGAMRERVTVEAEDGAEAYAYPHPRGIAWGVNAAGTGVNILRGVRRPDGSDEAVS